MAAALQKVIHRNVQGQGKKNGRQASKLLNSGNSFYTVTASVWPGEAIFKLHV